MPPPPLAPAWAAQRPHLRKTFLHPQQKAADDPEERPPPFSRLPAEAREAVLCEDLLNALLGCEAQYISSSAKEIASVVVKFHVDPDVDKPLAELLAQLLPLAGHYQFVSHYVAKYSGYEWGAVAQAFAAAADAVLKEYMILVGKLEDQVRRQPGFSLQMLRYHLQPAAHNMEALFEVCHSADVAGSKGGHLLQVLYKKAEEMAGDAHNRALVHFLLEKASVPYFEMLDTWLYQGRISDPAEEFLVKEQPRYMKEDRAANYIEKYWDQRYVLREQMLPDFLQPYSQRILTTGKYLNVVRECGRDAGQKDPPRTVYREHHREYGALIDQAYAFACRKALALLLDDEALLRRLASLKHYFFLDQGDLFLHLVNVAEEELAKPCDDIGQHKLEAMVEHAVRISTTVQDPFHADVSCELLQVTLANALRLTRKAEGPGHTVITQRPGSGQEAFTFTYKVGWPLSLLISTKCVAQYQNLFRHLFRCKWVERQLCVTLISSQPTRQSADRALFSRCFSLRQRMLQFIQNFQYYMTFEVVEPAWQGMVSKMKAAANIDELMAHHSAFLAHCMDAFLLNNPHLFKTLQSLLASCVVFSEWFPAAMESRGAGSSMGSSLGTAGLLPTTVLQFEQQFDHRLRELLQQLSGLRTPERLGPTADAQLKHLIQRLDFNGYYLQRRFYQPAADTG